MEDAKRIELPAGLDRLLRPHLFSDEVVRRRSQTASREWTELLLGERSFLCVPATSGREPTKPKVLLPGSFNPPHRGHARMVEIASRRLGEPVWLEISIINVDKPPLDFLSIQERLDRLTSYDVCLTRAPTFVEKAELFPAATFAVGADTLARIADARYYHDSEEGRDAAIDRLERGNVRFLVFGRSCSGRFLTLEDLTLPPRLVALCERVPESEFREDVSSTDLRVASSATICIGAPPGDR